MKKFFFSLFIFVAPFALNAEIQDGKVVAGEIVVRNYSHRSIKINGYELKNGKSLRLDPKTKSAIVMNLKLSKLFTGNINESYAITSQADLDRLFNKENSFTLTAGKVHQKLDIPLVDCSKPSTPFGSRVNERIYFGCDLRSSSLEYDITILPKWLFGQVVVAGERFKRAQAWFDATV